jgi:protein subunit release factor A
MSFLENLDKILKKHSDLSEVLASGVVGDDYAKLSKEFSDLSGVVEKIILYKKSLQDRDDINILLQDYIFRL